MPELPVEADIDHVFAAELVDEGNIDDEVGIASDCRLSLVRGGWSP